MNGAGQGTLHGSTTSPGSKRWVPPVGVVELPTIVTPVRLEPDMSWRFVHVSAYLQPTDKSVAADMDKVRDQIVDRIKAELPRHPFKAMASAYLGTNEVKEALHVAARDALGHEWTGDVFIRSLMVY